MDSNAAKGKRFVITLDPSSSAQHLAGKDVGEIRKNIDAMFDLWVRQGVDTLLYRVSEIGVFGYPTKIGKVWNATKYGMADRSPGHKALDMLMAQVDPLAEAVEAARRHGIEILAWVTPYDSYYEEKGEPLPGLWGSFEEENYQQFGVAGRKGNRLRGIMEFHYPEVRDYWVRIMRELSHYDVNGIYISVKTHSWCQIRADGGGTLAGEMEFGFNEPVVELYKERHGVDPRVEQYDRTKLSAILGEGLTAFLRENRKAWADRPVFIGKVPISLIGLQAFAQYPVQLDLTTWAREKLINRISVGYDAEWREYGDDFADQVAKQVCPVAGNNIEVLVNVISRLTDAVWTAPAEFRRHLFVLNQKIMENPGLAGGSYHEYEGFYQIYGDKMEKELWPEFDVYRKART